MRRTRGFLASLTDPRRTLRLVSTFMAPRRTLWLISSLTAPRRTLWLESSFAARAFFLLKARAFSWSPVRLSGVYILYFVLA
jgi:hypothetical protein